MFHSLRFISFNWNDRSAARDMFIQKTPKGTFKKNLIDFALIKKRPQRKFLLLFLKTIEACVLIVFFIGLISIYGNYDLPPLRFYEISVLFVGSVLIGSFGYFFETSFWVEILAATLIVPGLIFLVMM